MSICFDVFQPDYEAQAEACNLARNYDDIDDSWDSIKSIIEFYGDDDGNFSFVARPGYFNDPDEVRPVAVPAKALILSPPKSRNFPSIFDNLFSCHPQFFDDLFRPFT